MKSKLTWENEKEGSVEKGFELKLSDQEEESIAEGDESNIYMPSRPCWRR